MESKEFLNEENYNRANKKIKRISLAILLAGLLIGGGLIAFGFIKRADAERINVERAEAAKAEADSKVAASRQRLEEIESELSSLQSQYDAKSQECDSMDMLDSDWFVKVNQCHREASNTQSQINSLESEQFQLKNATYTVYYDEVGEETYVPFFFIGGFILIASAMISFSVWFFTKRRVLMAYGVQSTMPIAHEAAIKTADKLTPTVSKAAGDIANSIAEGITRGCQKGQQ